MSFPGDNDLTIERTMKPSWLIQRLQKPHDWNVKGKAIDNPFSFGGGLKNGGLSDNAMSLIRQIFSFDYMGASEFEWGAVPKALSFLAKQASKNNLVAFTVHVQGEHEVYALSPKEYIEEVMIRVCQMRDNPYGNTKEHVGLNEYFDETRNPEYYKRTCGWLELDNGYMFFTDKKMFEATCKLFGVTDVK